MLSTSDLVSRETLYIIQCCALICYTDTVQFRYLKGELNNTPSPVPLDDTFRSYNGPDADGTTFPGNPDKIDYVMVDAGATVINAWIARSSVCR